MKKRVLSFLTMLVMLVNLFVVMASAVGENANVLDGKKVLFVGCSFTYYGGVVIPADQYNHTELSQAERMGDEGFFYQLCKENGANVTITDWTFGGHFLKQIFGGDCTQSKHKGKSINHLDDLTDRSFDYVILNEIQREGESAEEICESIKGYIQIFKEANPDVKIYYIIHDGVYAKNYSSTWLQSVELIENLGVTILDWGTLVWDIINGDADPAGDMTYSKSSFIVGSDTYHPNMLSGYLFALMTYCAITGESAVGQPYDFCTAGLPGTSRFNIDNYIKKYYNNDKTSTNFHEVLKSDADMAGLQKLADEYLTSRKWIAHVEEPTYTVIFRKDNGARISAQTYHYGDEVVPPAETPVKGADETYTYTFAGWDKEITNCYGDTTYFATYDAVYIDYAVEFQNDDGSPISSQTYHYGDEVIPPADAPQKADDGTYTYTFAGWDNEVEACTGNAVYTATYTAEELGPTVGVIVGIAAAALVVLGLVGFFIFRFIGGKKK